MISYHRGSFDNKKKPSRRPKQHQGVAQSGSVSVLGTDGRVFESRHPDAALVSLCESMLYKESYLQVADNSGAKLVKCIKILGKSSQYAKVGDSILVSVIKVARGIAQGKGGGGTVAKKGQVYKAIVIRTKKTRSNHGKIFYGQSVSFQENYAILVNGENPIGSRIFGPMSREIRAKK